MTMEDALYDTSWEASSCSMTSFVFSPSAVYDNEYKNIIYCSDGAIYVAAFFSSYYYETISIFISIGLAVICFLLIIFPYIYRIVFRITQLSYKMEILTSGDLSIPIISSGHDELSELYHNIEVMRCSIREQIAHENERTLSDKWLITSISHDLRTPLAKLSGYLEILKYEKYKTDAEYSLYLSKAINAAGQINNLSEEIIKCFSCGHSDQYTNPESSNLVTSTDIENVLNHQCNELREKGYNTIFSKNIHLCVVHMQMDDFFRITDNLFSNLVKYADKSAPILISLSIRNSSLVIELKNQTLSHSSRVGFGIGLPTIQFLLQKNGGQFNINQSNEAFIIQIILRKL